LLLMAQIAQNVCSGRGKSSFLVSAQPMHLD
jgi:hypothetical protein